MVLDKDMNLQLKAKIESAIETVMNDACEDEQYWDYYIHPELYRQMTDAVEAVFDSAQTAQKYKEAEDQ